MELLVVGAGAVGRWLGAALRTHWPDGRPELVFADRDPAVAEAAAERVGGRTIALDAAASVTAVCVAVPISAAVDAIATHAPRAERAVLDATGTMADPVAAMREHAPERERLSLHPLFAPAYGPGRIAVVQDAAGPTTDAALAALDAAGNDLVETTADEHDRAMETVQATTHAAILAFALAAEEVPDGLHTPVSETLAGLADRMLDGDPAVYAEIQAAFEGRSALGAAAQRVAAADPEGFATLYREAAERRADE